jgi:hypothetical protein
MTVFAFRHITRLDGPAIGHKCLSVTFSTESDLGMWAASTILDHPFQRFSGAELGSERNVYSDTSEFYGSIVVHKK